MRLYTSKFEEVARKLTPDVKTVLDIGCRDAVLKRYLPDNIKYTGMDLNPGPKVATVGDAENGLPFENNTFGAVIALDMLEHTDNIWFVFDEFVRVSRHLVMIVLPNSYHWKARLRYLRGKEGDKYLLSAEPIQDRHRWLTSYTASHAFAVNMAKKHNLRITESIMVDERRNRLRETAIQVFSKNLMNVATFFTFEKKNSQVISHPAH